MTTAHPRTHARALVYAPLAGALDTVLLVVFAGIGRRSHDEGLSIGSILGTSWPFLVGAALGWAACYLLLRRAPTDIRGGLLVWVGAIVGGMALRALTGQGVPLSFIAVASLVTAALLLGWRAIAAGVARAQDRSDRAA